MLQLLMSLNGRRVNQRDLLEMFYRNKARRPRNARIVINHLTASLEKVTKTTRANVRVRRTERAGPKPIEVWVESRA